MEDHMVVKKEEPTISQIGAVVVIDSGEIRDVHPIVALAKDEETEEERIIISVPNAQHLCLGQELDTLLLKIGAGLVALGKKTAMLPDDSEELAACESLLAMVARALRMN
jgi:hypothetical protein